MEILRGHFTAYLDPNEGLAYLGGNKCENCGRGYPMPDFAWMEWAGLSLSEFRDGEGNRSKEFEEQFDG